MDLSRFGVFLGVLLCVGGIAAIFVTIYTLFFKPKDTFTNVSYDKDKDQDQEQDEDQEQDKNIQKEIKYNNI